MPRCYFDPPHFRPLVAAERIVYPLVGARYETASWVNKAASEAAASAASEAAVISFYHHRKSRRAKKVDDAEPPAFAKFPNSFAGFGFGFRCLSA